MTRMDMTNANTSRWRMKGLWMALLVVWSGVAGAETITLAWDAVPCGCVAGYRVYFGTNAGSYPFATNVGPVVSWSVVLPRVGPWFFAATALDTNGLESVLSEEVCWDPRPAAPVLAGKTWVRVTPVFERSTNLVTWGSVTGVPTWFAATNRAEFFRVRQLMIGKVRRVEKP
jgi:hypothetical protein